ncbi:MAG: tetraacyldisaccharide 4'-kinase [Candidatus Omnitrophica bacterium CG11_big_fil_rev_8_21_14_0_20_41_12]|nr:MAG: tetraacyldisaccharide 4'-kinase [Candidatus Omnitrophica bacterium CG11_big_fil_rev_8_21_14_0_20_41_12]
MYLGREYLYNLVTGKIRGPIAMLLRAFLSVLSFIYGAVVIILAAFYRIKPARLGAKVISVGNITLGGTGKTTFVEYLSGLLSLQGAKVAVLSRGYRRDVAKFGARSIGDEPAMLQKKLPGVHVVVDKNRIKAAFKAIRDYAAQILILDDGLQQWRIFKDLEIVMIDAANPFGNHRLLPAGLLREPLNALKRADIFVLTQVGSCQDTVELTDRLRHLNSKALIIESIHQPDGFSGVFDANESLGIDVLKGGKVLIFSGIGNPQGFENSVTGLGINIIKSIRFADHHDYTQVDIDRIIDEALRMNADAVITTHKDAVKISELQVKGAGILALNIKLKITKNETEFNRRLLKLYSL